jgi:hypothetical protein
LASRESESGKESQEQNKTKKHSVGVEIRVLLFAKRRKKKKKILQVVAPPNSVPSKTPPPFGLHHPAPQGHCRPPVPQRHPRRAPERSPRQRGLVGGGAQLPERARGSRRGPGAQQAGQGDLEDGRQRGPIVLLLRELERVPVWRLVVWLFGWRKNGDREERVVSRESSRVEERGKRSPPKSRSHHHHLSSSLSVPLSPTLTFDRHGPGRRKQRRPRQRR